jgi:hypothetical protein
VHRHPPAHLLGVQTLEHDRIAPGPLKAVTQLPLKHLEVSTNLKIVARGPRLYDSRSRVTLGIKVDLLSFHEGVDPRVPGINSPNSKAFQGTLVDATLGPGVQPRIILPSDNGGRTRDSQQALSD